MRILPPSFSARRPGWVCTRCRDSLRRAYNSGPASQARRSLRKLHLKDTFDHRAPGRQTSFSSSSRLRAAPTRAPRLPDGPARTRFAPSPTGHLHIGGLRTALFSYLLAKRTGGQFVLRIEDTDQKRLVEGAEARLSGDLEWAGLKWDEGPDVHGPYGPYKQSLRNDIYQKHASELLEGGQAYRCFCTPQTAGEAKAAYVTSGCYQNCASLSSEEAEDRASDQKQKFTVRLHQPHNARNRVYPDLIYGNIQRLKRSPSTPLTASEDDAAALDAADTILVKSDGTPTYHFANVVDDHLMCITHVIRGSEWMASTPLHYDIYTAFDWKPPQFAHVGLLVDKNKAKLSKRNADLALDAASMRDQHGVLPAPLVNFLALLGWSNPTDNDVMELDALVKNFDLKFTKGNAMVRMEKLWFLQKAHVARQCERVAETNDLVPIKSVVDQIVHEVRETYPEALVNRDLALPTQSRDAASAYAASILLADSKSFQNARQYVQRNEYFFAVDPTRIPAEKEFYNKADTVTGLQLRELLRRAFSRDFDTNTSTSDEGGAVPHARAERAFHVALASETWRSVTDFDSHPQLCTPREPEPSALPTAKAADTFRSLLQSNPSSSAEEIARHLYSRAHPSDDDVQVLVQRYKALNAAVMKFLREKLSYSLPGPKMSAIVAILGREECLRRLEI